MPQFQPVRCEHDGLTLEGYAAVPPHTGAPRPAVLVMHSAMGLTENVAIVTQRVADLGYLGVATDMYGVGADISTPEIAGEHFMKLVDNPDVLRARTVAWFDAVAAREDVDASRIAALGYCFGGQCVLELARSGADLKAAVSYHGLLTTHAPAAPGSIRGDVAGWCGKHDPYAPRDTVDGRHAEMTAAGARYQVMVFGAAEHSFTDPFIGGRGMPGISYEPVSDKVSWAGTVALLEAVFRH